MFFWNLKSAKEIILTLLLFDYSIPLLGGEERRELCRKKKTKAKEHHITLKMWTKQTRSFYLLIAHRVHIVLPSIHPAVAPGEFHGWLGSSGFLYKKVIKCFLFFIYFLLLF